MQKLTNTKIKNAKATNKIQKLGDGNGLVLVINPKPLGSKIFQFNYRFDNKQKTISFGSYPDISLEKAREQVKESKDLLKANLNPSLVRKARKTVATMENGHTFEAIGLEWHEIKNMRFCEAHRKRALRMLEKHLIPVIGQIPIKQLTTQHILRALRNIEEQGKIETAHRAKQVASRVIRYAIQTGRAEHDVSQHLVGALRPTRTRHFAAVVEPEKLKHLLKSMKLYDGSLAVYTALNLTPHLFLRPSELRKLEWSEVNFKEKIIEIPKERMKMRKPHIAPLSAQAFKMLEDLRPYTCRSKYVFPSPRGNSRCISDNTVRVALRTLGYNKDIVTVHGFRATARTILDERLKYRRDIIEHQLAHAVKDANGEAYNRTSHLDDRRKMMQGWSNYLDTLKAQA